MMQSAPARSFRFLNVLLATCALAACSKEAPARAPSVPVRTAHVEMMNAPVIIASNGVVEPLQSVAVQAQVSGTLLDVNFSEGQDVGAGQVLFQIDPRPFRAALAQAQAALARDFAQAG